MTHNSTRGRLFCSALDVKRKKSLYMLPDRIEIKALDINPKSFRDNLQEAVTTNLTTPKCCWFLATFCIKTESRRTASPTLFKVSTNNMLYYVCVLSGSLV